jgi:hypothetical protein
MMRQSRKSHFIYASVKVKLLLGNCGEEGEKEGETVLLRKGLNIGQNLTVKFLGA